MSKHTKGPWKISEILRTENMIVNSTDGTWSRCWSVWIEGPGKSLLAELSVSLIGDTGKEAARGYPGNHSVAEMLANAKLIAACPALYTFVAKAADEGCAKAIETLRRLGLDRPVPITREKGKEL